MATIDQALSGPLDTETHVSGNRNQRHSTCTRAVTATEKFYTSGCPELDGRVLGGCLREGLRGGLVCLSAEGDVGILISLQVAVRHLHQDANATARAITTLPVAHVVRLLKGILRGHILQTAMGDDTNNLRSEGAKLSSSARASILGRVMISRIYGHDDLQAVLGELEEGVPFQRLWSTGGRPVENHAPLVNKGQQTEEAGSTTTAPPDIVIFTEIDYHFKWMRLQSNGGRLYELYGQLMRCLRALASISTDSDASDRHRLIFVLNSTLTRRPETGSSAATAVGAADDGIFDGADERHQPAPVQVVDQDAAYRLALAALQRGLHSGRSDVFRLCCDQLAKAQRIEPRYKTLLDYYCSLHICLTRLPADLVDMWGSSEGGSMGPADSSLWVAAVESDETEVGQRAGDRVGIIYQSRGIVQDASIP